MAQAAALPCSRASLSDVSDSVAFEPVQIDSSGVEANDTTPALLPPSCNTMTSSYPPRRPLPPPPRSSQADARSDDHSSASTDLPDIHTLPHDYNDSIRDVACLSADVASMKKVLGGTAALAAHAVLTQQQLDDMTTIRGRPELLHFYSALCQGLQCVLHIATASKTGCVQLDKNSCLSGLLGSPAGAFEEAACMIATALDNTAKIADGIPIASFVLKGVSSILNQVQGLKFDVRINRVIESLFPNLNPLSWTTVVEEVARRVTVACRLDIGALHNGSEDDRGRVKNWFRNKCSEYGMATLTSKAEDAVVIMALQKVDRVLQFALSTTFPSGLSETDLAVLIVGHLVASVPAQLQASPATPSQSSLSPPETNHTSVYQASVEDLQSKIEKQEVFNKRLGERLKTIEKMVPQVQEKYSSDNSGGLVLVPTKVEANSDVNSAPLQAIRPLQQQVVRIEHRVDEIAACITSLTDPVFQSHLEDLSTNAIPVMKKRGAGVGWQDCWMAVRGATLFYAKTYKTVMSLVDSVADVASDKHAICLVGCAVTKAQEESDKTHFAFRLVTPQVVRKLLPFLFVLQCHSCAMLRCIFESSLSPSFFAQEKMKNMRDLLWATSDAALRVAVLDAISRSSQSARYQAAPAASSHQRGLYEDQRLQLLGTSSISACFEENFQ
jgi:hypothetical protein